MNTIFH